MNMTADVIAAVVLVVLVAFYVMRRRSRLSRQDD